MPNCGDTDIELMTGGRFCCVGDVGLDGPVGLPFDEPPPHEAAASVEQMSARSWGFLKVMGASVRHAPGQVRSGNFLPQGENSAYDRACPSGVLHCRAMARNQELVRQWQILRDIDSARHGVSIAKLAALRGVHERTIR